MNNHLNFTGASHIPIIEYNDELCIILFAEPKYQIYMDSGGHAEFGESPVDTASREGKEESLNTFDIDTNFMLNYINYYNVSNVVKYKNYYAFFMKYNIEWLDIYEIYNNNREIIFGFTDVPDYWKESNNITIFSIESLLNGQLTDNNYFLCENMFGIKKIVHPRPIKYLLQAIKQGIVKLKENIWNIRDIPVKNIQIQKNITDDFLNDTLSIRILE